LHGNVPQSCHERSGVEGHGQKVEGEVGKDQMKGEYTVEVTVAYEISVKAESNDDAIELALDKWSMQEYDEHRVTDTNIIWREEGVL
jgi:hypothetical protein